MSNIFDGPTGAGTPPQEGQQNEFLAGNPEAQAELEQMQVLIQQDPAFAESQEYKDFVASLQKQGGSNGAADSDEEEEEEEEDDKNKSTSNSDDSDDDGEEDDDDDIFGLSKKTPKAKELKISFDAPKEMLSFLEEHFGVKDAQTFFNSAQTWRAQAQEGAKIKSNYEAVMNDLSDLPPELKASIHKWANNEDYTEPFINTQRLDWSESFENQDKERLVQHFLPEEYEELVDQLDSEEISKEEFEKQVGILARSQRKTFNEHKQALERDREEYKERIERQTKEFKKSALTSVEALSKAYPNFKKSEIGKIRSALVEGKLEDAFFDNSGNYKEDAAIKLAFAMYGEKIVDTLTKRGKRMGESETNRKVVDSSPTTVRQSKSSDLGQLSKEEQEAVSHLIGGQRRSSIFD